MVNNKTIIFLILSGLVLYFIFVFSEKNKSDSIVIQGKTFSVEVAKTEAELKKGLSGHKPLLDNEGMIFLFDREDTYGFWMRDMLFPIDIIWLTKDWKITHIENSIAPETYPKVYSSTFPSKYVLEVSAGTAERLGWEIGDAVLFYKK